KSALSWYTRSILYRFVVNQTTYEKQLAEELQVTAGRADKERVILVTARMKEGQPTLRTSVDLLQSANQLHRGEKDAQQAYQLMSGLFASRLEGEVLTGNKADLMEIWNRSSDEMNLFLSA